MKKQINGICGELFADSVALRMCDQCPAELLEEVMMEIWELRREYVSRLSHTEKGSEHEFYQHLRAEFAEKVEALNQKLIAG